MDAVQKVFIARHGERQDLVDSRWHETAENPGDPPLTETGLQQAHQLGLRLQGEGITHIYASPFLRTVQTAHEVAKVLDIPVKVEHGFSEGLLQKLFPYGQPRMLPLTDLQRQMPLVALERCSYWGIVEFPESYKKVSMRVKQTTRVILERHPEDTILFVGHGLSVEAMVRAILPKEALATEPAASNIPYCALSQCRKVKSNQSWALAGPLWDDQFLQIRQDTADAEKQTKLWGL